MRFVDLSINLWVGRASQFIFPSFVAYYFDNKNRACKLNGDTES